MFARSAETLPHQMTTFTIVSASATYTSFCQRSMASLMLSIAFWVQVDSVMMLDPVDLGNSAPLPLANRPSVGRSQAQLVVDHAVKSWRVAAAQDGRAGLPEDSP